MSGGTKQLRGENENVVDLRYTENEIPLSGRVSPSIYFAGWPTILLYIINPLMWAKECKIALM